MRDELQDRVRNLLATSTYSLRSWALARLTDVLLRASARVPPEVRATGQRFGNQLWKRIVARYPALDELIRDPAAKNAAVTGESERVAPVTVARVTESAGDASAPLGEAPAILDPVVAQDHNREREQPEQSIQTEPQVLEMPRATRDVPALLRALRDPSAEVAAAAASALYVHPEPATEAKCQAALREVLENAEGYFSPVTRVAALQSLVQRFGAAPTQSELAPVLRAIRDVDAEVSIAAIVAVAMHAPHPVAVEHLAPIVRDESGFYLPLVRHAASRALERSALFAVSN